MGDGFVPKSWLANARASARMDIVEVVFVIRITLHTAAGLQQQDLPALMGSVLGNAHFYVAYCPLMHKLSA